MYRILYAYFTNYFHSCSNKNYAVFLLITRKLVRYLHWYSLYMFYMFSPYGETHITSWIDSEQPQQKYLILQLYQQKHTGENKPHFKKYCPVSIVSWINTIYKNVAKWKYKKNRVNIKLKIFFSWSKQSERYIVSDSKLFFASTFT